MEEQLKDEDEDDDDNDNISDARSLGSKDSFLSWNGANNDFFNENAAPPLVQPVPPAAQKADNDDDDSHTSMVGGIVALDEDFLQQDKDSSDEKEDKKPAAKKKRKKYTKDHLANEPPRSDAEQVDHSVCEKLEGIIEPMMNAQKMSTPLLQADSFEEGRLTPEQIANQKHFPMVIHGAFICTDQKKK
jgi:hypothetical protein